MRPDQDREHLRWELQTIRAHLHRITEALTTAMNRIRLIEITLGRLNPLAETEEEKEE